MYLVTTSEGHVLVNGVYPASVPLVRASVEALGFRMADIKLMVSSHAHPDHVSGNAELKALTGASVLVMDDDVDVPVAAPRGRSMLRTPRAVTRW